MARMKGGFMKYFLTVLMLVAGLFSVPISMIHYRFEPSKGEPNIPAELRGTPLENDYYILQFNGPVTDAYKQGVLEFGGEFYYYIPENAFVVKLPSARLEEIKRLPQVAWIGYYHPVIPWGLGFT